MLMQIMTDHAPKNNML